MEKRISGVITLPLAMSNLSKLNSDSRHGTEHIAFCFDYANEMGMSCGKIRAIAARLVNDCKRQHQPLLKKIARSECDQKMEDLINELIAG